MTKKSLRTARKKKGISQIALAQKTGVSKFRIQQFELGYSKLTKEEKDKLKGVLR